MHIRRIGKRIVFSGGVLLLSTCYNPFFPDTDVPQLGSDHSSPEKVIQQLVKAYENKRISLFEDLFDKKEEFRFYIKSTNEIDKSLKNIPTNRRVYLKEVFIPQAEYLYLDYNQEKQVHQHLFNAGNELTFSQPLILNKKTFIVDTVQLPDSTIILDSIGCIIFTDKAKLTISSDVLYKALGKQTVEFPIAEQVFYMKKDAKRMWYIRFWYELN